VLAWVSIGCGPTHHPEAVTQYHAFIQSVFQTYCKAILMCCSNPPPYPDAASCLAALEQATFRPPQVTDAELDQGIVVFDRAASAACLATLMNAAANCDQPVDASVVKAYFCNDAVHGTLPAGAACSYRDSDYECVPGARCSAIPPDKTHWWLGTCVGGATTPAAPGAMEAVCSSDSDCMSFQCVSGACAPSMTVAQFLCGG
jgi:hypothetical protein